MTVRAERSGTRIVVESAFRDKEYLKALPGARWDNTAQLWHVPLSWASCKALRGTFGDRLEIGPDLVAWAQETVALHVQPMMALRGADDWAGDEDLRHYQRVGTAFLTADVVSRGASLTLEKVLEHDLGGKLLGDDMGTGKTVMGARALRNVHQTLGAEAVFPAVIVCPAIVKGAPGREKGWYGELAKWFPEARVGVVRGTAAQRRKVIEQVAAGELDVIVINWENLRNHSRLAPYGSVRLNSCQVCDANSQRKQASCERCPRELNEIQWRTVIADEIHRAKDPKAKQTRALWALTHQPSVAWRWGLSGTITGDAMDQAWAPMHAVAPREYPSKTKYIDRYALQSWNAFGGMEVVGIRAETRDEFFSFFDPRFLRRPWQYALRDLKEPVYDTRFVEMCPKQRKLYNELADEMIGRLDDGDVVIATNPLTLTARLNQAAAAFLDKQECASCAGTGTNPRAHQAQAHPDEQYTAWYCVCSALLEDPVHKVVCGGCNGQGFLYVPTEPSCKIDALEELLDELGEKEQVVVFAVSRKLIELTSARLTAKKIDNVIISGALSERQKMDSIDAFRAGTARVCLIVIAAGGEGLDGLQVASTAVFLQRDYSLLKNEQAERRLHRSGQENQVRIIDIRTEGTIEDDKELILAEKAGRVEELLRDKDTLRRLLSVRA